MVESIVIDPNGTDIHGEAARLRHLGCALRVELPAGIPAWLITRHQTIKDLLLDSRVSKDPRRHWPAWIEGKYHDTWVAMWVGVTNMLSTYGTDHRRLRRLVAPAFTARRTEAMRPRVEAIATSLLDSMDSTPPGTVVDLRSAYAHPLPMHVICELFGVPGAARPEVARLIGAFFVDPANAGPEEVAQTIADVHHLLDDLIAMKRSQPEDDMTSVLVASLDEDGSTLSEEELRDTLLLTIGAGFETTVNLIGNAIHTLFTHSHSLEAARTGTLEWEQIIEETLRWAPPVAAIPLRFAIEDIELADGTLIPAGDAILPSFASAGRDEVQHSDPGTFEPSRQIAEHLAFGYGVHRCIGAPLARMEAEIALRTLFQRFPDIRPADSLADVTPTPSFIANGWSGLPAVFTRTAPRVGEGERV